MQLVTPRIRLCPLTLEDAPEVQAMASDRRVSALALNIPYPFPADGAVDWISSEMRGWAEGSSHTFSLRARESDTFLGVAGLKLNLQAGKAELGYTLVPSAWGQGYATEACGELICYGFEELGLQRISANYLAANSASGRVLEKLGFRQEGRLRPESPEGEPLIDLIFCGLLREEYTARK